MGCFSANGVDPDNIKLEPMDCYFGDRNVDCITTTADVALSLEDDYFLFETTDFDAVITEYYMWYNGGTGSDPALAGKTGVEVTFTSGDTANTIATLSKAALDALATLESAIGTGSEANKFSIKQISMGAVTTAADGASATGFTFANDRVGSKEFLGGTEDVETAFEQSLVDIKASQSGDILLGQLVSSVSCTVSFGLLELTAARWSSIVGNVMGANKTKGTDVLTGVGKGSIGKNLLSLGKELLLKPVNSASDNSRNLTFFRTAPAPGSVSFSGTELSTMSVDFSCYLNDSVDEDINLYAFGDSFNKLV